MPDLSEIPEKYHKLINDLVPSVANAIDMHGGLCFMDHVCCDQRVRYIRAQLPPRDKIYRIHHILASESEFFTILDNQDKIATAMAYESGLLNYDGEITPEGDTHLENLRVRLPKENDGAARSVPKTGPPKANGYAPFSQSGKSDAVSGGKGKGKGAAVPEKLYTVGVVTFAQKREMATKLYDAMLHGSEAELEGVMRDARRLKAKEELDLEGPPAHNARLSSGDVAYEEFRAQPDAATKTLKRPLEEVEPSSENQGEMTYEKPDATPDQILDMERIMRICVNLLRAQPDNALVLSKLAADDDVKCLKPALNGASFKGIFDTCYPQYFSLDKHDSNQMFVTMLKEPPVGSCPPQDIPMARKGIVLQRGRVRKKA